MYNKQATAAKGDYYASRNKHLLMRSMQRAPVSIYKTENTFELLVFAPGRIKEHFQLSVKGNELTISYTPPEGFPQQEWILREYSRGGFVRSFTLDESTDAKNIIAKYVDGVLQVTVPILAGKEVPNQQIMVS